MLAFHLNGFTQSISKHRRPLRK